MTRIAARRAANAALRDMNRETFLAAFAGVVDDSPWVAEAAWEDAPFASLDELHAAMAGVIASAGRDRKLALLRAHPELAGKAAADGRVTKESRREQSGAGLAGLTAGEHARFRDLNRAYRERFGFPFIVAVRNLAKDEILRSLAERLGNAPEAEFERCLSEVAEIVRLRLADRIAVIERQGGK